MRATRLPTWLVPCLLLVPVLCGSCRHTPTTRPFQEAPPQDIKPTVIEYVDSDAFDSLLESALTNQDPAILIHTSHEKPDWDGRLNAWIAAWNRGGVVEAPADGPRVRMQAPLPGVRVDEGSIREFRLLVEGLMNRVEDLATRGTAWWTEEKIRSRRVALLKPYNLRFHMDGDGHIQIVLFNGRYASSYRNFMQTMGDSTAMAGDGWQRIVTCSHCKERRNPASSGEPSPNVVRSASGE